MKVKKTSKKELKRKERKHKFLIEKKAKNERRESLIETCKANFVTEGDVMKLLKSTRDLGRK